MWTLDLLIASPTLYLLHYRATILWWWRGSALLWKWFHSTLRVHFSPQVMYWSSLTLSISNATFWFAHLLIVVKVMCHFLHAKVLSEREITFTFAICYRPSVCLSSVMLVRPTQAVVIFCNISMAFSTLAIRWHPHKILRRSSQGTPPPGELNTRGVVKYSDFGPIDGYISETVQDRR